MKNSIIGYPRIGEMRELKFWTESYFEKEITSAELLQNAQNLRGKHWRKEKEAGIDYIPCNDFSFYDCFIGLDFIEGKQTRQLIEKYGFPKDKTLFAGVVNGKNIWKCNYKKVLETGVSIKCGHIKSN